MTSPVPVLVAMTTPAGRRGHPAEADESFDRITLEEQSVMSVIIETAQASAIFAAFLAVHVLFYVLVLTSPAWMFALAVYLPRRRTTRSRHTSRT